MQKKVYLLLLTTSWGAVDKIAAVCTTPELAVKFLKKWYEKTSADYCKHDSCDCEWDVDEKFPEYSSARIFCKTSRTLEKMRIETMYTDFWRL